MESKFQCVTRENSTSRRTGGGSQRQPTLANRTAALDVWPTPCEGRGETTQVIQGASGGNLDDEKGQTGKGSLLVARGSNATKEVLLLGTPVSGPGGIMPSATYPSFEQLRLVLSALAAIEPDALDEAARALGAGKSYGIYNVMLTEEELRRLGLVV